MNDDHSEVKTPQTFPRYAYIVWDKQTEGFGVAYGEKHLESMLSSRKDQEIVGKYSLHSLHRAIKPKHELLPAYAAGDYDADTRIYTLKQQAEN